VTFAGAVLLLAASLSILIVGALVLEFDIAVLLMTVVAFSSLVFV
jgi:hypothetical protein